MTNGPENNCSHLYDKIIMLTETRKQFQSLDDNSEKFMKCSDLANWLIVKFTFSCKGSIITSLNSDNIQSFHCTHDEA